MAGRRGLTSISFEFLGLAFCAVPLVVLSFGMSGLGLG